MRTPKSDVRLKLHDAGKYLAHGADIASVGKDPLTRCAHRATSHKSGFLTTMTVMIGSLLRSTFFYENDHSRKRYE